ncbi:MAG: hypothetical protein MZV70_34000 [Desulfobacterales bacterium]|nr:hypothetical protein [Desulfobacterales bacterium]
MVGDRIQLDKIAGLRHRARPAASSRSAHVFTVNEALRKVPGVFARDEEGFGLRPNIGIRGLNPTRSTQGAAARGRHPARLRALRRQRQLLPPAGRTLRARSRC